MIVKIKSYKKPDFQRLLEYMINDEKTLYEKNNKTFIITHNIKGQNLLKWVKQFKDNEKFRQRERKDSVRLTHEIISFHKGDSENISVEKLEEITREYISRRNTKGIYVAVPHFDKEHYHIHICASGLEYKTGKSLRMSKAGFQKLKKDFQNFQLEHFPELNKSVVVHDDGKVRKANVGKVINGKENEKAGKVKVTEKEYQQKLRTKRATKKEQVVEIIEYCLKTASSKNEFYKKLNENGLETYKRSGKIKGVVFEKIKFRFSRLGFPDERLEELEKSNKRKKDLSETRSKKTKITSRNR